MCSDGCRRCDQRSDSQRKSRGRPALVAYITAGFPERETFLQQLAAVAEAADVVEIGVPFTDPMADGTTIQRSSRAALAQGVSLQVDSRGAFGLAPEARAPLLLMSYLNPLLAYGLERLPEDAARAGIAGFIVPDLPFEECDDVRAALAAREPRARAVRDAGDADGARPDAVRCQQRIHLRGHDDGHDRQERRGAGGSAGLLRARETGLARCRCVRASAFAAASKSSG